MSSKVNNGKENNYENTHEDSFANFKMPKFNIENLTKSYKKNLDIVNLMSKMSMDVYSNITKLQSTFIKNMTSDLSEISKTDKPSDAAFQFSEVAKNGMAQAINNGRKMMNMLTASSRDLSSAISKKIKENTKDN